MMLQATRPRAYCTIFNSLYLARGIALFRSLCRHDSYFVLYVYAMDVATAATLRTLGDERLVIVEPSEFEDAQLISVRSSRSVAEYFWTCTPSIIRHTLIALREPECTYVDADVWLTSDPAPLFEEMGTSSVLLTEHRYAPRYDQSGLSGRFCVQFMRFVADDRGMLALEWWRDRCIEWCFARREGNKFGDQKYLDDWTTRFEGVHVLQHIGGGVAPWNFASLAFRRGSHGTEVSSPADDIWFPVVFCHFHSMKSYSPQSVCLASGYVVPEIVRRNLYAPYVRELLAVTSQLRSISAAIDTADRGIAPASSRGGNFLVSFLRRIYTLPNTYSVRDLTADGPAS